MSRVAAALAERATTAGFGAVRDLHSEGATIVDATLGFVDTLSHSLVKALRAVSRRGHGFGLDALDAAEQSVLAAISAVHTTGHDAAELASRTASSLTVGPRGIRATA